MKKYYLTLFSRSIIVHSQVDNGCTQPTGDAGSRISQCIIGLTEDLPTLEPPSGCCGEQDASDCEPPDQASSSHPTRYWMIAAILIGNSCTFRYTHVLQVTVVIAAIAVTVAYIVVKRKKRSYRYEYL